MKNNNEGNEKFIISKKSKILFKNVPRITNERKNKKIAE